MKFALTGRSMISPFGLAMRPRMPASWRICLKLPRAPDVAIMKMGFVFRICFIISSATSSVARPQISTTFSLRSPSVIRPCCQRSWIFSTCSSKPARISPLRGGVTMSFLETVTPARVA